MRVMEAEVVIESKRKRKKQNQEEFAVYYCEGISESDVKFMAALLSWRYGIRERTYSIDDADIVVVAKEEDAYSLDQRNKLVLIAEDRALSRSVADQVLKVVSDIPTIFIPPISNNWLLNRLRICKLVDVRELESKLYEIELAYSNFARFRELRSLFRAELIEAINKSDYVVVVENASPLHVIAGSVAYAIGKPVIAQTRNPSFAAFADIAVPRQEDLIAVVSSLISV